MIWGFRLRKVGSAWSAMEEESLDIMRTWSIIPNRKSESYYSETILGARQIWGSVPAVSFANWFLETK